MGHHHHGGGHHHHHHHAGGLRHRWGHHGGHLGTSWPVAAFFAGLLFLYGVGNAFLTYRVYAHGTRGMGVVTRVVDGTTIMEVDGRVCAISGEHGRVGGMVPVAFPPGRPADCVLHELTAFRWDIGAILAGGGIALAIFLFRRNATAPSTPS